MHTSLHSICLNKSASASQFISPARLLCGVQVDTDVGQHTERISTQAAIEEPHIIDPNTRNEKNG